jgi:hypothetical protein
MAVYRESLFLGTDLISSAPRPAPACDNFVHTRLEELFMVDFPARYRTFLLCTFVCSLLSLRAHAQIRRALLIGIDHYAPPAGAVLPELPGEHARDSRFSSGSSWFSLQGPSIDVASMQVLLKQTYGFTDIKVLPEEQATRQGILSAIDELVAKTKPGDIVVLYYSGHGSRRLDTLSSKDQMDETIVPIDAWKGAEDIRDKELAVRFNQIVFDHQAHLTAIFDSCNSGTMARGLTQSVLRALPYDDRDVAEEKRRDPSTVTEADLKRKPQDGDAIIVAAASASESAVEALYPDDHQFHGAFTRALVRVLTPSSQSMSAVDTVAAVSSMLHADRIPFQQPSVEGRVQQSLFGDPVAAHALHARVEKVSAGALTLDVGSAAGFDVGTQFTSVNAGPAGQKTLLEVTHFDGPVAAVAQVIDGPANVRVGSVFEVSKMVYPHAALLLIFASNPDPAPLKAAAEAQKKFPRLTWVDDPTATQIEYLVVREDTGWVAYSQVGNAVAQGAQIKGKAYLLLGPPEVLKTAIEQSPPFKNSAYAFTKNPAEANYLLAMRSGVNGQAEYAFLDPIILSPHKPDEWVKSVEDDPYETQLNNGATPEVVCRNDVSLPVRTAWLPDSRKSGSEIVTALNRRIVRLGKLRLWLQSQSLAPGINSWPYHLAVVDPNNGDPIRGILHSGEPYQVRLVTDANQLSATAPSSQFVYLFGFDCAANPFLLYPSENLNGGGAIPQPGADGRFPLSVSIKDERVGTPLGADSLFLLATAQKISDPAIFISDGILNQGTRGVQNRFEELIGDMNNANTRGPVSVPSNWAVQQVVLPSRP